MIGATHSKMPELADGGGRRSAALSIKVLSDYLERHPESIIRGKKEDSK